MIGAFLIISDHEYFMVRNNFKELLDQIPMNQQNIGKLHLKIINSDYSDVFFYDLPFTKECRDTPKSDDYLWNRLILACRSAEQLYKDLHEGGVK